MFQKSIQKNQKYPKSFQKESKKYFKSIQKVSQNNPKSIPKASQNYSKVSQKYLKSIPKQTNKHKNKHKNKQQRNSWTGENWQIWSSAIVLWEDLVIWFCISATPNLVFRGEPMIETQGKPLHCRIYYRDTPQIGSME